MSEEPSQKHNYPEFDYIRGNDELPEDSLGQPARLREVLAAYLARSEEIATAPVTPYTDEHRDAVYAAYLHGRLEAMQRSEPDSEGVWAELSEKRREIAHQTRLAMAEKFGLPESAFSLVNVPDADNPRESKLMIIHSALYGIDVGDRSKDDDPERSYNNIMSQERTAQFTIDVNGQTLDARTGLTLAAYQAMIEDATRRGVDPLPDSQPFKDMRARTLLTGEKPGEKDVDVAFVDQDQVGHYIIPREHAGWSTSMRPAVEVPEEDA